MITLPEVPQFGGKLYSTADGMIHMSILPNQRQPWPACHVGDAAPADMIAWSGQAAHPENPFYSDSITCPGCLRCLAADEIMAYQSLAAETHRDGVLVDDGPVPLYDEVTGAVFATPGGFIAHTADLSPEELDALKQRFVDAVATVTPEKLPALLPDFAPQVRVSLSETLRPSPPAVPAGEGVVARADFWAAMASSVNGIRDYENCERCDHDTHRCPGCGDPLTHGAEACVECNARIDEANALPPGPDICHQSVPKQCVRELGHDGPHRSNSGTEWPDPDLPGEEQRQQMAIGPDWCHVHNRVAEVGREECAECDGEQGEDRKAGE